MFYKFSWLLCRLLLAVMRRWEVNGEENLPRRGGVLVVSNHTSYWDPVVVGCALRRRVYFMAKAELFKIPLLGFIIKALGAFPVRRDGADRASIRRALELLRAGEVVGIFPEGTRSHHGELLEPHLGAAMLALKGGVPMLPVAVIGSRGVFGKVRVAIGKPMEFPALYQRKVAKTELQTVSREVMAEISRLLAEYKDM